MENEAQFIVLIVATSFLFHDYEYCLQLTGLKFSHVDSSLLFDGNLSRFQSLASLKLFELVVKDPDAADEDFIQNFDFLIQAILCAQKALEIYEAGDEELFTQEINNHGKALSEYTLGYIYHKFAEQLCDQRVKHVGDFEGYLESEYESSLSKAIGYYSKAADSFKCVAHKMGIYLSRKREL